MKPQRQVPMIREWKTMLNLIHDPVQRAIWKPFFVQGSRDYFDAKLVIYKRKGDQIGESHKAQAK